MNTNKSFDNSFDGLDIYGRDKVQIYTYLHMTAMEAKKIAMPFLVPLHTSTKVIYDAMFVNISVKTTGVSQRVAQTKEANTAIKSFKKAASKTMKRASDKLGEGSVGFIELFNTGMKYYNDTIMENAYIRIQFLRDGTVKYGTELGADIVTLIEDCYIAFDAARQAQVILKTNVEDNNPLYDVNYVLLKKQLNKNLHTISLQNDNVPRENYIFFTDSVLETPSHHKGKNNFGPWILSVQPLAQIDSLIAFSLGQKITIQNLGSVPIYYMGAVSGTELFQPSSLMIMPGEEIMITAVQLGCPQNKFLLLKNKDLLNLGVVKITLS